MNQLFKFLALSLIRFYQLTLSLALGPRCRFYPSCSHYAKECFEKYSLLHAAEKSVMRICRCHPWSVGGVDLP